MRDVTYDCVLFLDSVSWKLLYTSYIDQPQGMEVAFCVRHLFSSSFNGISLAPCSIHVGRVLYVHVF